MRLDETALLEISSNFKVSRIILTANELDVFTFIQKGFNTQVTLAKEIKADPLALAKLLNALVAVNFLKKVKDRYYNMPCAARFLVKGKDLYLGNSLLHYSSTWDRWSGLTQAVKKGSPARRIKDTPERARNFTFAMCNTAKRKAAEIERHIDFSGVKKFLDLGGGPGIYSIQFCRKNKNIKGVIFDRSQVIRTTKEIVAKSGLKIKMKTGDFLRASIGEGYDLVFLSSIIHIYPSWKNLLIFKKIYSSLNPGGKIVISDFILNPDYTSPRYAAIFSINMLTATSGGQAYSYNEVKNWLGKCSFKKIKKKNILDVSLIFAEKAREFTRVD